MEFLGIDVHQAGEQVEQIQRCRERLAGELEALDGAVRASQGFWIGADADHFRERWSALRTGPGLSALEQLSQRADTLETDIEQQETASARDDGGAAGGGSSPDVADDGDNDRGTVDPEVAAAWRGMTDEERRAVAQEIVDAEFEKYGMDSVEIDFDDIKGNGYWREGILGFGQKLAIDEDALSDPDILHTLAHEVRHAAQHEFIERTEPRYSILGDNRNERFEEIEAEHGVTREEIEEWDDNFGLFSYKQAPRRLGDDATPEEQAEYDRKFQEYLDQPVEVDAREGGREFVEDVTMGDLQDFQREADVPVSEP